MTYPQAQSHPYAMPHPAMPFMPPPYAAYPGPAYAPPPPPPPVYAAPYAYAQPYPAQPGMDAIDQRLRAYAQAETAVGSVPGADQRILSVIDAAVRTSESKAAAAIDALATLMEKQRRADEHKKQPDTSSDVARLLAAMTDRLAEIEKSVKEAGSSRDEAALAHARQLEGRIGEALDSLATTQASVLSQTHAAATQATAYGQHQETTALANETVTFEAANDSVDPAMMQREPVAVGVRPPPRAQVRPRITVPRASLAVAEIAARQRALDSGAALPARDEAEPPALESIRRSIAALADQVRDTARLRERKNENDLRDDIKDLQRSVQDLAPRQIVASVNESIRMLAQKIERSREDGVRESQLAPLEALLNEIRSNLLELREPRSLQGVQDSLGMLARRIEAMGERSADAAQLDELQRQLADIRSVISAARNDQPFERLNSEIRALSDKLDAAAERPRDTRAMLTLAEAVEDMRSGIRQLDPEVVLERLETRLASLDGLERRIEALSQQISQNGRIEVAAAPPPHLDRIEKRLDALTQRLGEKPAAAAPGAGLDDLARRIEQMTQTLSGRAAQPDFSPILQRIDAMQETIARQPAPAMDRRALEGVFDRLASRIDDIGARSRPGGLDELQAQMVSLADRLDRTTPNHPALGGMERVLNDLCKQVAALEGVARAPAGGDASMDSLAAEGMMLIKRDLTDIRTAQTEADSRSRDVLVQVNASLEKIVARLGTLESEAARPRPAVMAAAAPVAASVAPQAAPHAAPQAAPHAAPPAPKVTAAAVNAGRPNPGLAQQSMASIPDALPPQRRPDMAPLSRGASDGDLDLPLEPGARGPIASSFTPGDAGGSDARSTFIAAARRAAQVAQEEAAIAIAEADAGQGMDARSKLSGGLSGIKSAIAARRKPLLLGLAAAVVAIGGVKVAFQILDSDTQAPRYAGAPALVAPAQTAPAAQGGEAGTDARQAQAETPATEPVAMAPQPPQAVSAPAAPLAASVEPAAEAATLMKTMAYAPPEKLRQAALSGNPFAAYEIAARLAEGRNGAARDLKNAALWMELAAAQGLPQAQYRLGSFHREGLGVPKNNRTAYALFQKAAEQGNILAMHNLAVLHAEGVNGAADYGAAAQWFRNAAEHGVKDSQFNIAVLYLQGLGVAADLPEAYKWFYAAARQGDPEAAKRRDAVLAKVPAERQEAVRQAAENFRARRPEPRANEIVPPEGGWDDKRLPTMAKPQAKSSL